MTEQGATGLILSLNVHEGFFVLRYSFLHWHSFIPQCLVEDFVLFTRQIVCLDLVVNFQDFTSDTIYKWEKKK